MSRSFVAVCIVVSAVVAGCSSPLSSGLELTTTEGRVRGSTTDGVRAFMGLPYAAPPIGDLRFRSPTPPAAHPDVRDATTHGPSCIQNSALGTTIDTNTSEDCLTLNIWTPDRVDTALPVMVFLHGGGFVLGTGSDSTYDGSVLASTQNVVVVTLNYRLGSLGFLRHPAFVSEDSAAGNYAIADQRRALEWVRDNIRNFGGDAKNVTLFGESAGAISTCLHLVSPPSRGLFHRAIMESGPCTLLPQNPAAAAETQGRALADAVGCTGSDDAIKTCLRQKPAGDLFNGLPLRPGIILGTGVQWFPTQDGILVPDQPRALFAAGQSAPVPLIVGSNGDEGTLFLALSSGQVDTEAQARTALAGFFTPAQVDRVAVQYPLGPSPKQALTQGLSDLFTCDARRVARLHTKVAPTFLYNFTRAFSFIYPNLGAFHSAELPFVFGNPYEFISLVPEELPLSKAMQSYWTHHAKAGDPNSPATAVAWPRYDEAADQDLGLDLTITPGTHLRQSACDFWDSL